MSSIATEPNKELAALFETQRKTKRWARYVGWMGGTAITVLLVAFGVSISKSGSGTPQYEFVPVTRGNLNVTVSATGNLAPTNKVEVGSELSGIVEAVLVQENDRVKKGQVLARLDTSKPRTQSRKRKRRLLRRKPNWRKLRQR